MICGSETYIYIGCVYSVMTEVLEWYYLARMSSRGLISGGMHQREEEVSLSEP